MVSAFAMKIGPRTAVNTPSSWMPISSAISFSFQIWKTPQPCRRAGPDCVIDGFSDKVSRVGTRPVRVSWKSTRRCFWNWSCRRKTGTRNRDCPLSARSSHSRCRAGRAMRICNGAAIRRCGPPVPGHGPTPSKTACTAISKPSDSSRAAQEHRNGRESRHGTTGANPWRA